MGCLPKYSIHRISVLLSSDETRAIFENSLPMDAADDDLRQISDKLQNPVIVATERFGELVLDRSVGWFEAETEWNGEPIHVNVATDNEKLDKNALKTAETLWSDQAKWKKRIEAYVVKELLELKNDSWLGDDESELTANEFLARMTLTSISISFDEEFELWYDDDDLFWGHAIMVRGNVDDGPTDAGVYG